MSDPTISPEQCRAARGWLNWTQEALAERAKVSLSTVRDFESGKRKPIANNLAAMRDALESGGIVLTFDNAGKPAGVARSGASHSLD